LSSDRVAIRGIVNRSEAAMPFIHIKSLPFKAPFDAPAVVTGISRDFAEDNAVPLEHVHVTWEYFPPGHFAQGDRAPEYQPDGPHSVLVDLLTPDFNDRATVQTMLETLAQSIARRTDISMRKIFINQRQARSGRVFDDGAVVKWKDSSNGAK
jgi:hypothetical protein